jgi:hypothetical protein
MGGKYLYAERLPLTEVLLVIVSLLLLVGTFLGFWRSRRIAGRIWRNVTSITAGSLLVISFLLSIAAGYYFWYNHRPIPANTQQTLFEGITYTRESRSTPRPLVIHVATVDLNTPGIAFLVTPPQPNGGRQLRARTTSTFLTEFGLQLAINGDFFSPFWSNSPFDYGPHAGEPVDIYGFASSKGQVYSTGDPAKYPTLYISLDNRAQFGTPMGEIYNAISGNVIFIEQGKVTDGAYREAYHIDPHPRTAVGLTKDGRTLIIVVVDGRQPNYSEGISLAELAEIMIKYGVETALNLDGGGSSALIIQGQNGGSLALNSPIDNRIPGRERVVGNHLGIFARKLVASRP